MVSTVTAVAGMIAAIGYTASTAVQVRGLKHNAEPQARLLWCLLFPSLALHGLVLFQMIGTSAGLNLNLFTSGSLVAWVMVCFLLFASLRAAIHNLLLLVAPLAALSIVLELSFDAAYQPITSFEQPLIWHILLSIVAYSILFMAACQSLLLALLEDRLRSKQTFALVRLLPPLQTMENLLFSLLRAGVTVLTLAILTGFIFLEDLFAQRVVHHTVLAIASWLVFTTLLIGHHFFGWRGSTAIRWTLIGFTLLLLGYFGSKFVIEILLGN
jgi:ABC-type uncharacterized transport system permease subunit